MRSDLRNLDRAARIRMRDADDVEGPPGPADVFARLGVLMMIALGFGLAAELLVGVLH
jgi:hypothetical protein